ncbi:extracellular solute-binding protein [Streptomyces sp. NPDC049954]|uniref:extracellular solute-binding protein n=1 Tax=Streptomyces sp. NPDC049954 TaxID=3155779 RepID=UPI00341D6AF1
MLTPPTRGPARRTVLTALGALGAGAALTGCSGMDVSQPQGSGPRTGLTRRRVRLRMGVLPGPTERLWTSALVEDFQKLHPNISVELQASAQITDLRTTVTSAMSGDLPDIMFSSDVLAQSQASKGLLLDLSPYLKDYGHTDGDFIGKIMELGRWEGRQYVLPRGLDQVVVAYNPRLFDSAGLEQPRQGWTWQEFKAAAAKIDGVRKGERYWGTGTVAGWSYGQYPVYVPFMRGWGGDISEADGSRATLDDPRVARGVREMMSYFGRYSTAYAPPPVDPFLSGRAGMNFLARPQVFSLLASPDRMKWAIPFKPGFASFPLFPTPRIGAGMAGWAGTVNTRHPHETAAFLMYTLSARGQRLYAKIAGEVPVRSDLADDPSWQDTMNFDGEIDQRAFTAYGDYQSFPPGNLPLVSNAQMATAVQDALDSVRLGTTTPEEAMRRCNRTVNDTLVGLQQ